MAITQGLASRRGALRLLDAVLRRGETLEQAEKAALRELAITADRGLARAMASEVLRWLTDLDALIDSTTRERLPDDAKARMVLRLMLAQALRLETPPHAVIATGLPLLAGGPRRLAHGVFSALMKRLSSPLPPAGGAGGGPEIHAHPNPSRKREGLLPSVPTLPENVTARWGTDKAAAIAPGLAFPPSLDLALRDPAETARWAAELGAVSLMPGHLRLARGTPVEHLAGFDDGAWWVQDFAAQLPARLLGPGEAKGKEGKLALDLCAAPGGKTLQLAAAGWQVTSVDASKTRLARLRDNLARTGLDAEVVRADALEWEPAGTFDAVLLDAPCTATGTCRRHPDVLHRIGAHQIGEMAELQAALLARALGWLRPGGVLVYAVCSLEREEGEDQAAQVTLEPLPIQAEELPAGLHPSPEGWLRTHPGMLGEAGGMDGFFVARWRR